VIVSAHIGSLLWVKNATPQKLDQIWYAVVCWWGPQAAPVRCAKPSMRDRAAFADFTSFQQKKNETSKRRIGNFSRASVLALAPP